MKRRGTARKPVLDLNSKADSPVRQSWQTKYQQICQEHSQNGGSEAGSPQPPVVEPERVDSPKKRRLSSDSAGASNNPLKGLLGQYNSDDDTEGHVDQSGAAVVGNGGLDAKVEDFLKEIQEIAPLEKPVEKKKKKVAATAKPKPVVQQADATELYANATAAESASLQPTIAWQECFDEGTGYAYYWNMHTNEVTWQMPAEYQQYLVVLEAWQRQQAVLVAAAAVGSTASDAPSQQPQQSNKKTETKDKSTKNKQLDKRKSKKSDDSGSEDEKIELITSYGQSSSEDSDSEEEMEKHKPSVALSKPQLGLGRAFQQEPATAVKRDSVQQKPPSVTANKPKPMLPKSALKKSVEEKLSALQKKSDKSSVLPKIGEKTSVLSKPSVKPSIVSSVEPSLVLKEADKSSIISKGVEKSSVISDKLSVSSKVVDKPSSIGDEPSVKSTVDDKPSVTSTVSDKALVISKETDSKLSNNPKSAVKTSVMAPTETKPAPVSYDSNSANTGNKDSEKESTVLNKPSEKKVIDNIETLKRLKKLKRKTVDSESDSSSSSDSSSEESKNEEDDDDDDDDEDINESDILARLKNQANILKELGGEVPDSIKALISDDGPTSFSLIAGYGDSDAEDDKEAGQEKVEKKIEKEAPPTKPSVAPSENKPLFPIMESVKAEADKMKVEENEQSRNEVKEKKEEPKKTELEDARLAANRKVIKLSARAKTLIKNSVTTAKARATDFVKTDQGLKPAKSSDVTQIKGSGTKDTQPPTLEEKPKPIAKPEPESKKKTKLKSVALTSSSSLEPPKTADVGKTVSAPSSDSVNHTTIVNTAGTSVSSSLAYTSTWSYGSEHPSGERRGFGFSSQPDVGVSKTEKKAGKKGGMIQFVKSDTVLNEPAAVEKAPVILEEKKLVAKTVTAIDPDTEATLKDLATVIKEKTTFLSEGKEPISAVQVMSIQLEMLTNAWSENALSSDFYHNWLMSVTRQLTSLEMSATPLNWACFWDRSHKRYYYRETQTGRVQWEYPVVADTATAKTAALASTPPLVDESAETALVSSYASDDAMDLCNTPPPPPLDDEDEQPPMPPPPPNISFGESEEQAADKDTTTEDTSCSNGEPPQAPPPPMISDSFDMNSKSPPPPPVSPPPLPPPPPTMSESTPPAPDPNLSLELSSFYSDLAALDPPPKPPAPAPLPPAPAPLPPLPPPPDSTTAPLPPLPPLPPSQPPPPTDPPLPNSSATSGTKKKKKPKLGTGLSLKKRGYSSLMEKWQQIAEDEKDSD